MQILALPLLAAAIIVSGCATTASYDYDRAATDKIAAYESFSVASPSDEKSGNSVLLSELVDRRIERSIKQQLSARGFEEIADTPDFIVAFHTMTQTRSKLHEFPVEIRRRSAFYRYHSSFLDLDEFEEGTYVIDIVDGASNELVWRGSYRQRLGWEAPDEAEVQEIVTLILSGFPPSGTN